MQVKIEESDIRLHDVQDEVILDISDLVQQKQSGMVLNILVNLHIADQAQILSRLDEDEAETIFSWLPPAVRAEILPELDGVLRNIILEDFHPSDIADMVDELDSDDAADVLADLPHEVTKNVLPELEDEADMRELLRYEEDSAGGLMAIELVSVLETCTVAEATEEVRRLADKVEPIYAIYVVNAENVFTGVVSLKQLLLSPAHTRLKSIIEPDAIAVQPEMDQEHVARIMEKYDLTVLPVVDAVGRLIGRITIDDIVDVIREEAEEDFQRMSGISSGDEELSDSVFQVSRGRLPWLVGGLVGSTLAGLVVLDFSNAMSAAPVLGMFIPIVSSTAGNIGIQSSAIVVQGLASGSLWMSDMLKHIFKELRIGLLNGLVIALVLTCFIVLIAKIAPIIHIQQIDRLLQLCGTSALAMVVVIMMAAFVGTAVPLVLHRFGIDPAIATGPFITTSCDIFGLLIYFMIAQWIYFR